MDFAKIQDIFLSPEQFQDTMLAYMEAWGYTIDKNKSLGGIVAYHQQSIAGLDTQTFFEGIPVADTTNLDTFVRPQGEHFVITQMKVLTGVNDPLNNTAWVPGVAAAEIINGNFTLTNNGVNTLPRIPFSVFTQAPENPFSGFYDLPFLSIWAGQETIVIRETQPTVGIANQNVRFELHGLGLVS